MPKTIDDYMNDPELVNEPSALREVHAIRLKIYDEIKNMSATEMTAYFNGSTARLLVPDNSLPSVTANSR